eukprot:RCo039912
MGFGVAGALGFGYVAFYCFGSAYIRPGMLKSTRPQFLRDYFTTGVLRDQYPRPLSMLMNYTFPELARNLIALIGVVGPVTWNAVLGNRIGMGLYIVGGSFGGATGVPHPICVFPSQCLACSCACVREQNGTSSMKQTC